MLGIISERAIVYKKNFFKQRKSPRYDANDGSIFPEVDWMLKLSLRLRKLSVEPSVNRFWIDLGLIQIFPCYKKMVKRCKNMKRP